MFIVFVCMRYVKKFGCHYNQSGVLKIEILILQRLARFQNLGSPPTLYNICQMLTVFIKIYIEFCEKSPKFPPTLIYVVYHYSRAKCASANVRF